MLLALDDEVSSREDVLLYVAGEVNALPSGRRLVAIDGVDGSGKTVFAAELATALRSFGREVIEIHVDDFHHLRARRYQRGRSRSVAPHRYQPDPSD